jgi:hypothetical protein
VINPRDPQRVHVRAVDLIERRVPRVACVATGRAPVRVGNRMHDAPRGTRDGKHRQRAERPPRCSSAGFRQEMFVSSHPPGKTSLEVMQSAYTVEIANAQPEIERVELIV